MAWWTAVPALTPLVAHDVLRVSATHFLDGVGTNNMGLAGCSQASAFPTYLYSGGGLPMPYTATVAVPATAVLCAMIRGNSTYTTFYNAAGSSGLGQESDGRTYAHGGSGGQLSTSGVMPLGVLRFVAMVKGASDTLLYTNGAFVGMVANSAGVMTTVDGVGYLNDNSYCFDGSDRFGAAGLFSGTPTLADMQALEAAVRAELAAPQPSTNILAFAPLVSSAGAQAVGAPGTVVVDVGQVRVRLSAGFAGLGSIEGVVTVNNVPAAKQVRLFDKATGALVAATQSAASGAYAFAGLDSAREYFVVSHDNARQYNAVISDMITP